MGLLRDFLRENTKELFESLERSWETAFDTWLSAVSPNLDTYNSYPHLRNLEVYADKVAAAWKKRPKNRGEFLSPLEVYILLASILFHDIGKARGGKDHGVNSGKIIMGNWGVLGIPNEELAYSISRICVFHDYEPEGAERKILELTTAVVDPYGVIREREIATILMLVDHIDGSFIRIVPDFIRDDGDIEILGAFRKKVRGIDVDVEGGMVKVVLGENKWENGGEEKNLGYRINDEKKILKVMANKELKISEEMLEMVKYKKVNKKKPEYFAVNLEKAENEIDQEKKLARGKLYTELMSEKDFEKEMSLKETLIIAGVLRVTTNNPKVTTKKDKVTTKKDIHRLYDKWKKTRNKKETPDDKKETNKYPDALLLTTLLGNTLENLEALEPIKSTLASMGLPIRGWLLEYKDRLFNYLGNETFEPIFTKEYLIDTARCMWMLSTRIFGHGELSYETLAAQMREPDIVRVKRAVKRIGIITTPKGSKNKTNNPAIGESDNEEDYPAIWYGDTGWRWRLFDSKAVNKGEGCCCKTVAKVEKTIEKLVNPGEIYVGQ